MLVGNIQRVSTEVIYHTEHEQVCTLLEYQSTHLLDHVNGDTKHLILLRAIHGQHNVFYFRRLARLCHFPHIVKDDTFTPHLESSLTGRRKPWDNIFHENNALSCIHLGVMGNLNLKGSLYSDLLK